MADFFISHSSKDRGQASKLDSSLEECGWTLCWDRKIPAGQTFDTGYGFYSGDKYS